MKKIPGIISYHIISSLNENISTSKIRPWFYEVTKKITEISPFQIAVSLIDWKKRKTIRKFTSFSSVPGRGSPSKSHGWKLKDSLHFPVINILGSSSALYTYPSTSYLLALQPKWSYRHQKQLQIVLLKHNWPLDR